MSDPADEACVVGDSSGPVDESVGGEDEDLMDQSGRVVFEREQKSPNACRFIFIHAELKVTEVTDRHHVG